MSSAWWLGNRCMLGLSAISQTTINLLRTKQCVLNLPSDDMKDAVDALAYTTGAKDISTAESHDGAKYFKKMGRFEYVHDKFGRSGLTPQPSECVQPALIAECPAQMETELVGVYEMFQDADIKGCFIALEVKVLRTHVYQSIRLAGHKNRVDPDLWHPMIMSFRELYGLSPRKPVPSVIARVPEEAFIMFSNPAEDDSVEEHGK